MMAYGRSGNHHSFFQVRPHWPLGYSRGPLGCFVDKFFVPNLAIIWVIPVVFLKEGFYSLFLWDKAMLALCTLQTPESFLHSRGIRRGTRRKKTDMQPDRMASGDSGQPDPAAELHGMLTMLPAQLAEIGGSQAERFANAAAPIIAATFAELGIDPWKITNSPNFLAWKEIAGLPNDAPTLFDRFTSLVENPASYVRPPALRTIDMVLTDADQAFRRVLADVGISGAATTDDVATVESEPTVVPAGYAGPPGRTVGFRIKPGSVQRSRPGHTGD